MLRGRPPRRLRRLGHLDDARLPLCGGHGDDLHRRAHPPAARAGRRPRVHRPARRHRLDAGDHGPPARGRPAVVPHRGRRRLARPVRRPRAEPLGDGPRGLQRRAPPRRGRLRGPRAVRRPAALGGRTAGRAARGRARGRVPRSGTHGHGLARAGLRQRHPAGARLGGRRPGGPLDRPRAGRAGGALRAPPRRRARRRAPGPAHLAAPHRAGQQRHPLPRDAGAAEAARPVRPRGAPAALVARRGAAHRAPPRGRRGAGPGGRRGARRGPDPAARSCCAARPRTPSWCWSARPTPWRCAATGARRRCASRCTSLPRG